MKKNIILILLIGLLSLPITVKAEVQKENLETVFKSEEIEYDLSNYKETDDQITIYLFRGKGCAYCHKLLTFLNSIIPEYGKYFKLESYETWNNVDNSKLMQEVSTFLKQPASGVPYLIIGDQVFSGYAEAYDESIKNIIKTLYETKKNKRYDVFKEMKKANLPNVNDVLIPVILFVLALSLYYQNRQYKILNSKLDLITNGKSLEVVKPVKESVKKEKVKKSKK